MKQIINTNILYLKKITILTTHYGINKLIQ